MKLKFLTLSILLILFSCLDKNGIGDVNVPEPKVITINKDVTSIDFLPNGYQKFFYFKDSKSAYETFKNSELYSSLNDNYLFLDLKYNYLENVDMFFTKFNFDFNSVFNYINADTTFGVGEKSFFLIASMTWESKVFISLLNIAPDSVINESEYKGQKLYTVKKGNNSLHYAVVNNYVVFSDTLNGLKESILSVIEPDLDYRGYTQGVDPNEVVYVTKIDYRKNPFDLFPNMSEIKVKYNTVSQSVSYSALPISNFKEYIDKNDDLYHETLKYFDKDTPLVLYNSSYDIKGILNSLISSEERTQYGPLLDILEKRVGGVYFLVDDLVPLLSEKDPELGFILNINPGEEELDKIKDLTQSILGVVWGDGISDSGVTIYRAQQSSFSMVISNNNIAIFTNQEFAKNYMNKIITPEYSLYDKHKDNFYDDNSSLDSFICYNPEEIKKSSELIIKRYIFSSISMDDDEYLKSFGEILDLISDLKSGYMNYSYDKESNEFYGSIKKLP